MWLATSVAENDISTMDYEQITKFLAENCATCYGSNGEKLKFGIARLEKLVAEQAVPDQIAARAILKDTYNGLAQVFLTPGSDEQKVILEKIKFLNQSIVSGARNESESQYILTEALFYKAATQQRDEAIATYKLILEGEADNNEALFLLGKEEYLNGDKENGLIKMEQAFAKTEGEYALNRGAILVEFYSKDGKFDEAGLIFQAMKSKNIDSDFTKLKIVWIDEPQQGVQEESKHENKNIFVKETEGKQMSEVAEEKVISSKPRGSQSTEVEASRYYIILGLVGLVLLGFVFFRKIKQ